MQQVYVKYNPYRLETTLKINGKEITKDSDLYKLTKGKRLQEWIGEFPAKLEATQGRLEFSLEFCGMDLDWDDFEAAFKLAQEKGKPKVVQLKYIEGKKEEDINDKIVKIFQDMQNGPVEEIKDPKLIREFNEIYNSVFPVNVFATMSSGKSTLINALLRKKLMPSKNEACTATITEIYDTDDATFTANVYNQEDKLFKKIDNLDYGIMNELNEDKRVKYIEAKGDIPFLDSNDMALMIADTPGPNNSQTEEHQKTTYRAIDSDSNNLILYVLNGTQLGTNDDAKLLHYIAEQIKKGGKQVRDRFLFVINKMDQFNPEEEDIPKVIQSAKEYLAKCGIDDPQIFPCSAFAALNIRTELAEIDVENLTRAQERQLSIAAKEALAMMDKLNDFEAMHFEKYSTLSPSMQERLNYRLQQAVEKGDTKEQALVHSGICSIEDAITAYVKKYAKTKKIKDLVETFQEVLESNKVLAKAEEQIATDEAAARACRERAAVIEKKIADGNEAKEFKQKIDALNPQPQIKKKADLLKQKVTSRYGKIFRGYGEIITSRDEAERLVNQFYTFNADSMAELTVELENIVNGEIVNTGEQLLKEYQERLLRFDEISSKKQLNFRTTDLIKGALSKIRKNADNWTTEDFASKITEEYGETIVEEQEEKVKVGEEKKRIETGEHKEQIGTKKVKCGSHQEQVGTRKVKQSGIGGFFKRIFTLGSKGYDEEPIYETVDDYKEVPEYIIIKEYETIIKDITEVRTKRVEKFSVKVAKLQQALIAMVRYELDEGMKNALDLAYKQIEETKKQFSLMFDELDKIITKKYQELNECAADRAEKEKILERNQKILKWIEINIKEIDAILDME